MVSSVQNAQKSEFFVAETDAVGKTEDKKGNLPDSADSAYDLSFSEEGWEVFDKLSEEDQRKVDELEKIDKKVRIHEQAHLSAAGGYARGGANYDYVTGPDGKRYASSGHVNIDTSPEKTPEATIRKADIVRKAALAPADPSPADRQIATDAEKMKAEAQKELENKASPSPQKFVSEQIF